MLYRTRNSYRSTTAWEGLKASTPRASFPKLTQSHSSFIDGAAGISQTEYVMHLGTPLNHWATSSATTPNTPIIVHG